MPKFHRRWIVVALLASGLLAPLALAEPHKDRCVILISVDGLANFYLDDPLADMPTIRRMMREGARANGTVCSFPTVTWPNHTTLVTGVTPARHGVIGNSYLDRQKGTNVSLLPDPLFDKDEIVKVPTVYDAAHGAGLVTAGIIWPATRNAKTLDWTVPDMFGDAAWPKYGTPKWLEELKQAGIPIERHGSWTSEATGGVQRDWLYTRMARHVLANHALNLLLIHLVEVDHVEHRFGPRSPEAYWAVSYADDRVRDIAQAVEQSPYKDKTTIIVASDHGFFPIDREIRPNILFQKAGLIAGDKKQAMCVSQGGACMVYVLDDAQRAEITQRLQTALASVEGVEAVFAPSEFSKIGQPTPADDPRAPDLWLAAKSGYSFADTLQGDDVVIAKPARAGTHGYLPDQPDLLGTLVLSGHGVKRGATLEKTSNLNVAPTIARLLGVELPTADGKALEQALSKE